MKQLVISSFFILSRLFNHQLILLLIIISVSVYFPNLITFIISKWQNLKKSAPEAYSLSHIISASVPKQLFRLFFLAFVYGATNLFYSLLVDNQYPNGDTSLMQNPNFFYSHYFYLLGGFLLIFSAYFILIPGLSRFTARSEPTVQMLVILGMQHPEIKKKFARYYSIYASAFFSCGLILSLSLAFLLKIGFLIESWI